MTEENRGKTEENAIEKFETEDENPERGNWSGKLDFLLSCLGYAVGLGNVWRFPYLCYKHGGGAFLIPYTLMLLFIGIPCFFMEISIGQYAAMGPVTIYSNLAPVFKGLGFANFLASCFVGLYYNMIIAWTIYYMFASFTSHLPWSDCENDFNTDFCFSIADFKNCTEWRENPNRTDQYENIIYHRGKCLYEDADIQELRTNYAKYYPCETINGTVTEVYSDLRKCVSVEDFDVSSVELVDTPVSLRKTSAQEYLTKSVLKESEGLEHMGEVQWHLALCLLAAWIVIFCCLIKGIKSSGKVVYFTATFPYFVLLILLIKAVTLPGAYEGIKFYIIPDWSRLADVKVWEGAAVQIFFSLSVAGGGLITLASYNKFHNNIVRDTIIVCFGNCLTSVFAGFAIFSVLGFLATEVGVRVEDVVQSGTGLAFIAYPDLVTRFPWAPFWAILFFSMLFTLGLDSQFAIVETILSGVLDFQPNWRPKKTYIVGLICVIGFLCGLPLTCEGGGYLLDLLDYYAAGWPYLFIGLTELVIISHVYGITNFLDDLYHICKFNPGLWFRTNLMACYMTASPFIIFIILMYSWFSYEPLTKGDYEYPPWANAIGWIIAMTAILAVPIVAVFQMAMHIKDSDAKEGIIEKIKSAWRELSSHTEEWRANANRARAREQREADNSSGFNKGVDNLAVEDEE